MNDERDTERITHNGVAIEITRDEAPPHPRKDYDNVGTMVCFHKRYRMGDQPCDYHPDDFSSYEGLKDAIAQREGAVLILPIYLYDHSGTSIRTEPFSCPWDSGQVGFIFVSLKKAREEFGRLTEKTRERILEVLRNEVETYDQYMNGDVWCYRVDPDGKDEESCGGFYGHDVCVQEAKDVADRIAGRSDSSAAKALLESVSETELGELLA